MSLKFQVFEEKKKTPYQKCENFHCFSLWFSKKKEKSIHRPIVFVWNFISINKEKQRWSLRLVIFNFLKYTLFSPRTLQQ